MCDLVVTMSSPVASDPWANNHVASPSTPDRRKHRKTWHAASPHKVNSPDGSTTPCLKITHFTKKVIVCFDVVKVGKTKRRTLKLINPHDYPQMVELERISPKKGFFLEEKAWDIQPKETLTIPIFWTPPDDGNYRDLITFLCEGAFRLQVILLGTAEETKRVSGRRSTFLVKRQSTSRPLRPSNASNLRIKRQSLLASSNGTGKENKIIQKSITKPLNNPKDRQGGTGSRRSTPLAAKTNQNVTGKSRIGDKGRSLTRIDIQSQENEGCFDDKTTSRVLEELSGATEPVKNVLIENVTRETLLVCEGMSPLLKTKKFDRNVHDTSPRCGSHSNQNVRKILKGTEIKTHPVERLSGHGLTELSKRTLFKDSEDCSVVDTKTLKSSHSDEDAMNVEDSDITDDSLETVDSITNTGNDSEDVENTASNIANDSDHVDSVVDVATCTVQTVVDGIIENTTFNSVKDSDDIVAPNSSCDSDNVDAATDIVDDATISVENIADLPERKIIAENSKEEERVIEADVKEGKNEDSENVGWNLEVTDTKGRGERQGDEINKELKENGEELNKTGGENEILGLVNSRCVEDEDDENLEEKVVEEEKEEDEETEVKNERSLDDEPNVTSTGVILVNEGKEIEQDGTQGGGGDSPGEGSDVVRDVVVGESDSGDAHMGEKSSFSVMEEKPVIGICNDVAVVHENASASTEVVGDGVVEENASASTEVVGDGIVEKNASASTEVVGDCIVEENASASTDVVGDGVLENAPASVVVVGDGMENLPANVEVIGDGVVEENAPSGEEEVGEKPAIGDVIDDVTRGEKEEVEKKGLVFIPLEDDKQTGINHSRNSKRVVEDTGMGDGKGTKKQRLADQRSSTDRTATTRGRKSSLSLNRTVALRRASATNSSVSVAPRTKPKVKRTMKGVPMAKLNLVKPARTALPRHPMPFAAKNMFYDERWVDKQERGFVQWLNYILTPEDVGSRNPSIKGTKIEASMLAVSSSSTSIRRAPTKEVLSLRAYTARRRLNQLRRASCLLFQSEPVVRVIQKLEALVENRGLSVRTDRKIHADLGMKQNILMMILCYNPLWLRIGLETIYGELLPVEDNSDIVGLSRFIVTRLLGNPDIAASYAHPTVPALFRPGYEGTLAKFTLKKFLLLVFFLDKAKLTRLIDHDPCLFCKDAQYKSSRDLLLEFSRLYLKGEGDITRHLNYIGYSVTHTQKALDEYDFAVVNLAKDLRDGVRIVRVTELLTKNWMLSHELRCPAISRLQKIHNVQVALDALSQCTDLSGCGVDAKSIVEGHREKTLQLLWSIIFSFKVETMLDEAQLKEETTFLWNNLKLKRKLDAVKMLSSYKSAGHGQEVTNVYFKSGKLSLLLKWCQAVCAYYSIQVENFTVSFCDGRVLCYLVHHYHPELIPLSSINDTTTQTENQKDEANDENDSFDGTWTRSFSPTTGKESSLDQLMKNEQQNFKALYQAIQNLGGVPFMIKSMDMSGTIPDEKVVITYTSYLCARLLDLCHETRAVRTIQMAWRAYQLRKKTEHLKKLNKAATVIQQKVRLYLRKRYLERREAAVIRLQTAVRGWIARRKLQVLRSKERRRQEDAAAVILQSHYRRLKVQRLYTNQLKAIAKLQAMIRGRRIRRDVFKMKKAVLLIEDRYTAHKQRNEMRLKYKETREAVIILQTLYRGMKARRLYREMKAAQIIQARWKGYIMKRRYQCMKNASVLIQSAWRMYVEKKRYTEMKKAAGQIQDWYRAIQLRNRERRIYLVKGDAIRKIQAFCRGLKAQRMYERQRNSCILIQATVRSYQARKKYQEIRHVIIKLQRRHRANVQAKQECQRYRDLKEATTTIQSVMRGWLVRKQIRKEKQAACLIQAHVRGFIQRKEYIITRQACITLQSDIRCYQQRQQYLALKRSALLIQSVYRGQAARRQVKAVRSAVKIQATYRMYRARCQFQAAMAAIITCQSAVRCFIIRRRYVRMLAATKVIQRHVRGWLEMKKTREEYCVMKSSCTTIQSAFRGYVARQQYLKARGNIITCQAAVRSFIIRKRYVRMLAATKVIQRHVRGWLEMQKTRDEYCVMKSSCTTIQSAFRGYVARQQYLKARQNIITCQAAVRSFIIRRRYVRMLAATRVIQRHVRGWLEMKKTRDEYCVMKSSCTTIQSAFRGYVARQQYLKARQNIITCQAAVRSFIIRRRYVRMLAATRVIQRHVRGWLEMKKTRDEYCVMKSSCTTIQSAFRGYVARRQYLKARQNIITCQAAVRSFIIRKWYVRQLAATKVIQRHVRGWLEMQKTRDEYCVMKSSCTTIQSVFRGYVARQQYKKTRSYIITCQSLVRTFIDRRRYQTKRNAAIVLQRQYRALQTGRVCRAIYCQQRQACIVLQTSVRRYLCRKRYLALKSAAVLAQSYRRMVIARDRYQATLDACKTIQTRRREVLVARQQRKTYLQMKHAAVVLQSYYRGLCARRLVNYIRSVVICQSAVRQFILRQKYLKQRNAAIKIQAFVRGQMKRQRYLQQRAAVMVIQERWRSTLRCRNEYLMYHIQRGAVIALQSAVRGWFVRKELKKSREAAVIIQSVYRRHREMRNYSKTQNAIITLQRFARAYVKGRTTRRQYLMKKQSAVCIQSWWRMIQRQGEYGRMKVAAITLQAGMRMVLQYRQYHHDRDVIIRMQRRWRANRLADEEKRQYLQMKRAAIILQAWVRGMAVRNRVHSWHESATKIEAYWRGFKERQAYLEQRSAAVKIQRRFRAQQSMINKRMEYEKLRSAAITIQAMYRGIQGRRLAQRHRAARLIQATYRMYTAQREYHRWKNAAVHIQALFRCNKQRRRYLEMKEAASVLQKYWRIVKDGRMEAEKYQKTRQAVIIVQSTVRGWIVRKQYIKAKQSAVIIQSMYRRYRAVRSYQNTRDLVVRIQRRWRAKKLGDEEKRRYLEMKRAAITLQAWSRGLAAQRTVQSWHQNVAKIQASWRGFRERRSFLVQRLAAVRIQRRFRAHQSMRREQMKYEEMRRAAITIQAMYRGMQGRRLAQKHRAARMIQAIYRMYQTRREYQRHKSAAVLLQATFRGYKCRTSYKTTLSAVLVLQQHIRACLKGMHDRAQLQAEQNAAIVIQSYYRRCACRNTFIKQRKAAITLQSVYRCHRQQKQYKQIRCAAGKIQKCWRATMVMRGEVSRYRRMRDAVIVMQASVRCYLMHQRYLKMRKAVTTLQTAWRCIHARRTFVVQREAATIIQRRFRAQRTAKDCRDAFVTMKASAVTIQTTYRMYRCRKQFMEKKAAVVVIQSWVRGQWCLKEYQSKRTAAMVVQRWYRNILLARRIKREYEVMSLAALRIQSIWRGQRDRKRVMQLRWEMAVAKERLDALIKIQAWTRSRLQKLRFVRLRQATLLAQRIYKSRHQKRVTAVIVMQSYCRTWLAKRRLHKMQSSAITLQSIWRGRKVRASVKSKKIARARDRCMKACKAATEDKKLCNRTTSGLHFLLTYKHLHQVVEAVCSLEVATRLSARCCERLVAGKAVPVLFRLIKNCNRSLPCMEVIKYVVATLVNLAKYTPTAPSVLECQDAVSSILDLMMIYRETNPVIFTKAAMLLTVLAQDEGLQKILLDTSKISDKLRSLLNLQERKLKLKTRQMIAKSKSQGMTPSHLMTPSRKKRLVRSFQPDWVLGRFRRQDLEDPIEALKCLMGALNIKY